jgi:hypothetical protein
LLSPSDIKLAISRSRGGGSQMARDRLDRENFAGHFGHTTKSCGQRLSRHAVLKDHRGLEQENENPYGHLVVRVAAHLVQKRSNQCSGFVQTSELSKTHGTHGTQLDEECRGPPRPSQGCRTAIFVSGSEPQIWASEVLRRRNQHQHTKLSRSDRRT